MKAAITIFVLLQTFAALSQPFSLLDSAFNGAAQRSSIAPPAGFSFAPPFTIRESSSNTFNAFSGGLLFDVASYFIEGSGVYYVNISTGVDTNPGTELEPLKSLSAALAKVGVTTIYIAPGHYDRIAGGTSGGEYTNSVNIVRNGEGAVYVSRRNSGLSWALDGTYMNCYTTTRSGTVAVIDASLTDADGDFLDYPLVASAVVCDGTPGSYFVSGSTVYVNTSNSRAPDADIWVIVGENPLRFGGDITIYLDGVTVIGGSSASGGLWVVNKSASDETRVYAKNCFFMFGAGNGTYLQGVTESIFQNCSARKNKADGFNYQALNGVAPKAIEIDCTGFKNGTDDATDNDNGSSCHGGGSVVRINGTYTQSWGPNVIDIADSEAWNLGCVASSSQSQSISVGFSITGRMWLDTCIAQSNTTDLFTGSAESVLRYRGGAHTTTGGTGTIEAY